MHYDYSNKYYFYKKLQFVTIFRMQKGAYLWHMIKNKK